MVMFKLIASSYGENAAALLIGNIIGIVHNSGRGSDNININQDIQSVEIITEEELSRKKVKGAFLAVAGSYLLGPLGIAAYFMGGKHENNAVNITTKNGAVLVAHVSKEVRAKLERGAMASELYTPIDVKDFFEELDPSIAKAIKSAEEKSLCKKEDLDLSKCRKSAISPNKILLVNKSGRKIGLIEI